MGKLARLFGPDWGVRSIDGYAPADSVENRENIARFVFTITLGFCAILIVGLLAVPLLDKHVRGTHPWAMASILAFALFVLAPAYWTQRKRVPLWIVPLCAALLCIELVLFSLASGPALSPFLAVFYLTTGLLAFIVFNRRVAFGVTGFLAALYLIVVYNQRHSALPVTGWIDVVGSLLLVGTTVAWLVDRIRLLARRERAASVAAEQARVDLEALNHSLEARVAEQVGELERLGKLRRFLSPQVADSVLTSDNEAVLQPHRKQIAVFYCDLRGFTRFSSGAEPEDVVEILDEYYRTVGDVLRQYQATVGTFAGDGIMAYLNDPVPCEDPAYQAVQMALTLRCPMNRLVTTWKADGYDLGYGVGITYGYATLGMIGFESRNDYSAIGTVVNLAARLSSEARSGEILVDSRAMKALGERVTGEPRRVILKGIPDPVTAYLISGAGS